VSPGETSPASGPLPASPLAHHAGPVATHHTATHHAATHHAATHRALEIP
jgi:hypothetical protein